MCDKFIMPVIVNMLLILLYNGYNSNNDPIFWYTVGTSNWQIPTVLGVKCHFCNFKSFYNIIDMNYKHIHSGLSTLQH